MNTTTTTPTAAPAPARRVGLALTGVTVAFLLFDTAIKLAAERHALEGSADIGIGADLVRTVGAIEAACLGLYLVPRTAPLGAVLLTGYLGGAVALHLRLGHPLLSHTLFPVFVGALCWAGLALRDPRARALFR
ncbi:MAG: DoxX family protein [Myxococcota bacterium]